MFLATLAVSVAAIASTLGATASPAAAVPAKTDVMFVFDTSGSMGSELGEAKEKIASVMASVSAHLPDVAFGVSNVEDIPGYENGAFTETFTEAQYEEDTEKAWRLDQAITTGQSSALSAIEALTIGFGGDGPEAYARAVWESDTNPSVGWRPGARHEIVLIADNVPHDVNLNEGISPAVQLVEPGTDGFETWPDTGEEPGGRFGIPGSVWAPGTNLGIRTVASQLGLDGKPLQSVEFFGTETHYLPYWEYWAGLSGGQALNGSSGELEALLTSAIETGASKPLSGCPAGQFRIGEEGCVPLHASSTQVICNLVIATASDTCTATVGDASPTSPLNPTGTVTFTSSSGGVFSAGNTCTLVPTPMSGNTSSCSVQFLPPSAPSTLPAITAGYSGDGAHTASSGQTNYGPASLLATHVSLSGLGTIHPGGTVEVPIDCEFPCVVSGELFTLPGLARITSVTGAETSASAAKHKKKKRKKKRRKPVLLGKGTLTMTSPGKGVLKIKLSRKGKRALKNVGPKGVHLTLKFTISTLNATLVEAKKQGVTLKPKKKKKKKKKHHHH
jgi:hypothetical protein